MAYTLGYGTFLPGSRGFVVPMPSLEVDESIPVAGRVIAEGVADQWGAVTLPLYKSREGPPDQMGSSLLRCVAVTGPFGPRVVIYPRRTLAIELATYPAVPWAWTVPAPAAAMHDEPELAAVPELAGAWWEPRVGHQPHTLEHPDGPNAERGWISVAPDRRPTKESAPAVLAPYAKLEALPAARTRVADPEPVPEPPPAWWGRIIRAPDRTPTAMSAPVILAQYQGAP